MKKFSLLALVLSLTIVAQSQFEIIGNMPNDRCQFEMVQKGDSLFMVGGLDGFQYLSDIDIYDLTTESFVDPIHLSSERRFVTPIVGDSAIYFIGGEEWTDIIEGTNIMDIYKNGEMTTVEIPDTIMVASAVKVGSKIYVAGGIRRYIDHPEATPVWIYDELTGEWTSDSLSVTRANVGLATDGEVIMFAGGLKPDNTTTDVIDVYHVETDTWSTENLNTPKMNVAAVHVDGKFMFAGGSGGDSDAYSSLQIYDGQSWSLEWLADARAGIRIAITDSKVVFAAGGPMDPAQWIYTAASDIVDFYDRQTGEMDFDILVDSRFNHAAIGVGDVVYVAGGANYDFIYGIVESYDFSVGINDFIPNEGFSIFPNPSRDEIYLKDLELINDIDFVRIFSQTGEIVFESNIYSRTIDIGNLIPGVYHVSIVHSSGIITEKFVKM